MHKAVFLDRDGVINKEVGYLNNPAKFEFLPRAIQALKKIFDSEYKIVVVTNQSGVSRGYFTKEILRRIHDKMTDMLTVEGVSIDGIYFCPHHPDDGCSCRKPETGLIIKASKELDIDLNGSFFIGDTTGDILTGKNAGLKTILVETGHGGKDGRVNIKPDYTASDLLAAAEIILGEKDDQN